MENKLLKQTKLKLWKVRLMVCWRNIAMGVFTAYMYFWLLFPFLQGLVYLRVKPTSTFLGILCILAGITSFSFLSSEGDFIGNQTFNTIYEERNDLRIVIRRIKHAIDMLKEMCTDELCEYSLRELQNILIDIGIDATPIANELQRATAAELQKATERENVPVSDKTMTEALSEYLENRLCELKADLEQKVAAAEEDDAVNLFDEFEIATISDLIGQTEEAMRYLRKASAVGLSSPETKALCDCLIKIGITEESVTTLSFYVDRDLLVNFREGFQPTLFDNNGNKIF